MVSVVEDPMAGFLYALSSPISKAVYRVEESVKMDSFIADALHTKIGTVYTKYIQDPELTNLLTQDLN